MSVQWVEEKDWSKVKVGQRVRIERGLDAWEGCVAIPPGHQHMKLDGRCLHDYESDGWTLYVTPPPTPELPTEPGTVIAIGDWWLVRLRSYEGAPPAWEMLPLPSKESSERAKRNGAREQCVFGDEWVRAEVEQEGSYRIIAAPEVDTARKVLEEVEKRCNESPFGALSALTVLRALAAEFGVTEP